MLGVRAVGVNPIDFKVYSGTYGPAAFPMHLGSEAAGVVVAVGPDAVGPRGPVSVGDEVIAYRITDAYAARTVVPAAALVPKPANLAWDAASGLMLVGGTAIHALNGRTRGRRRHRAVPRRRRRSRHRRGAARNRARRPRDRNRE